MQLRPASSLVAPAGTRRSLIANCQVSFLALAPCQVPAQAAEPVGPRPAPALGSAANPFAPGCFQDFTRGSADLQAPGICPDVCPRPGFDRGCTSHYPQSPWPDCQAALWFLHPCALTRPTGIEGTPRRRHGAPARLAIALIAVCPSAPLTLRKAKEHGGNWNLAALIQVLAAMTAIVSIPLLADVYSSSFGVQDWDIKPQQIAKQIISVQLLPLGLAILVRRWRPDLASRFEGPIEKLAGLLLMLLIVVVLIKTFPLLAGYVPANGPALLAMALVVLGSLLLGYGLGGQAGPIGSQGHY